MVVGVEPIDANWWRGKVDNRIGIFPLNLVWEVDTSLIKVSKLMKLTIYL